MDIKRAYTFFQNDPDWIVKLLVTGLIGLIPIIGPIYIIGWMMEIAKRAETQTTHLLPEIDFGTFIRYGFKVLVMNLIYLIPVFVIALAMAFVAGGMMSTDNGFLNFVGAVFMFLFNTLIFIYALIMILVSLAGTIRIIDTGTVNSALDFKLLYNMIMDNWVEFLIVFGLHTIANSLIASAGTILCFVGVIFTTPYAYAASGHLIGQLSSIIKTKPTAPRPQPQRSSGYTTIKPETTAKPVTPVDSSPVTIPMEGTIDLKGTSETIESVEPVQEAIEETVADVVESVEETKDEFTENVVASAEEIADNVLDELNDTIDIVNEIKEENNIESDNDVNQDEEQQS